MGEDDVGSSRNRVRGIVGEGVLDVREAVAVGVDLIAELSCPARVAGKAPPGTLHTVVADAVAVAQTGLAELAVVPLDTLIAALADEALGALIAGVTHKSRGADVAVIPHPARLTDTALPIALDPVVAGPVCAVAGFTGLTKEADVTLVAGGARPALGAALILGIGACPDLDEKKCQGGQSKDAYSKGTIHGEDPSRKVAPYHAISGA
ncbi:hypothetical protein KAI87_03145 [Myxococcota bacterium]|nr:hypothetical protein [Myxococcota bacterium]